MDTPPPSFLPVRLKRETPFSSQLGCTGIIAIVLLAVATLAWFAGKSPGDNSWVAYVISVGFGVFGVLVAWAFIRQLAAIGLKETIVELSTEPLQPGESAKLCVIQPGPAKLKSLRANLVCLERRTRMVKNAQTKRMEPQTEERMVSTENLLDAQHINVSSGDAWHEIREFSLPADAPVAGTQGELTTLWKIEIWGAGYVMASFMHPFPIDVFRGQRPPESEEDDEDDEGGPKEGS